MCVCVCVRACCVATKRASVQGRAQSSTKESYCLIAHKHTQIPGQTRRGDIQTQPTNGHAHSRATMDPTTQQHGKVSEYQFLTSIHTQTPFCVSLISLLKFSIVSKSFTPIFPGCKAQFKRMGQVAKAKPAVPLEVAHVYHRVEPNR